MIFSSSRGYILALGGIVATIVTCAAIVQASTLDSACDSSDVQWEQCATDYFRARVIEDGPRKAYDDFIQAYETHEGFAKRCHTITHAMGEATYELYAKGAKVQPLQAYSYCSFGFYHGLLERLVTDTGDPAGGREFCSYLQAQIKDSRSILETCLHGFGHGITDGNDPRAWGSERSITAPGLELCETFARNETERFYCASGVFNALSFLYKDEKYGLTFNEKNPYAFCATQTTSRHAEACYRNLHPLVSAMVNHRFLPAARIAESIPNAQNAAYALENIAIFHSGFVTDTSAHPLLIESCYRLRGDLHASCIRGFVMGLLLFSSPDTTYKHAAEFCASPNMRSENASQCYTDLVFAARAQYSDVLFAEVCAFIPEARRSICDKVKFKELL